MGGSCRQGDAHSTTINEPGKSVGAILPQTIPFGTVTRRAVEKTWMTGEILDGCLPTRTEEASDPRLFSFQPKERQHRQRAESHGSSAAWLQTGPSVSYPVHA